MIGPPGTFGWFGAPPDAPAAFALGAAIVVAAFGPALLRRSRAAPTPLVLALLASTATALSLGYVEHYLRGGPRIVDATTYFLEARALAEGHVTWAADLPSASERGRFLLATGAGDAMRIGPIFPPGWPAALALAFRAGAPLAAGPVIAALLVLATAWLAKRATGSTELARIAAVFSTISAALRYHTADTMSHGLAALLVAASLAAALAARDAARPRARLLAALGAGLALGWLAATRPFSAAAVAPLVAWLAWPGGARVRLAAFAGAALPAALFVVQQRLVTGHWLESTQLAYYAVSDGPPGCFRWGFGRDVGCLHEHGDFVRARLTPGYGLRAALGTSFRRLAPHLLDVANAEPLTLLVPVGALALPRSKRAVALGLVPVALLVAYAGFYFDGNYPGGGGRMLADGLAVEHVLLARGLAWLAERTRGARDLATSRATWLARALALSFAGFAVHGSFGHVALCERDGGRPFFEPAVLERAGVRSGLLFVESDHGFSLAFDPDARDARSSLVVRHPHGDDRDRLLWERLGRPPAHRYVFDARGEHEPAVFGWEPPPATTPWRFEAEAEWPPLAQRGAFAEVEDARGTCAWGGAWLRVHPAKDAHASVDVAMPVPSPGGWRVAPHVATRGAARLTLVLRDPTSSLELATWSIEAAEATPLACRTLSPTYVQTGARELIVEAAVEGDGAMLDAFALEPVAAPDPSAPEKR